MVMAIAHDTLSLHRVQSILDLEDRLCAHHRVMAVTVEELRVDDLEEDEGQESSTSFVHARS